MALLKAGKDSLKDRDISNWVTHNYDKAVQQAGEVYGGKIAVTPVVYVLEKGPTLHLRFCHRSASRLISPFSGSRCSSVLPPLDPAWAGTPAGIKVLENFHQLLKFMASSDPPTVCCVEQCLRCCPRQKAALSTARAGARLCVACHRFLLSLLIAPLSFIFYFSS